MTHLHVILVLLSLLLPAHSARAEESLAAAEEPIEALYSALVSAMKEADRLDHAARTQRLGPAVAQAYDLDFMASKVLGRHWKTLSPEQQASWRRAFENLTLATYASRFNAYSGELFEVLGAEPGRSETALVRTRITGTDEEPVSINYLLGSRNGSWRIVDVYLNGTVSELALRRSEYSSVIKRDGFDALLRSVQKKLDNPESL